MSNLKKRILNIVLAIVSFVLLVGILFFAIEPGIPAERLNSKGVATRCLSLPNGYYVGDSMLGFLNGKGTFEFDTGESYTGNWSKHNMDGKGTLTGPLGTYDGYFKNSQKTGNGVFTWTDGTIYDGQWSEDKMNGTGQVLTPAGVAYTGTFSNNMFKAGTIMYKNGAAEYFLDVKDGALGESIKVTFANGITYNGAFSGKDISGEGKMNYPEIGEYVGAFKDGKRDGSGVFTWTDGVKYDGMWENDLMDGQGKYTFADGTYLSGQFEEGKLNGTYTYHNSDGDFKTVWEDGECKSVEAK